MPGSRRRRPLKPRKANAVVPNLSGHELLQAVYEVDQLAHRPHNSPRSIPATYVGFFDAIRQLYAQIPSGAAAGIFTCPFFLQQRAGPLPGTGGAGAGRAGDELPPAFVRCRSAAAAGTIARRWTSNCAAKTSRRQADLPVEVRWSFSAHSRKSGACRRRWPIPGWAT